MNRIFKLSAYLVDVDRFGVFGLKTLQRLFKGWAAEEGISCVQHLHLECADLSDEETAKVLKPNCDLSYCENHFQKKASAISYDRPIPQPGEHWKHFKVGKVVKILAVSRCTEAPDSFSVIYCGKYGIVWDRPLDMFMSEVDHEKYPDSKEKYRFSKVEER